VKAVSILLKVLRPMFIHITSPKQEGLPVSWVWGLCLVKLYKHWILWDAFTKWTLSQPMNYMVLGIGKRQASLIPL